MGAGLTSTVATTTAIVGNVAIGIPTGATIVNRDGSATGVLYTVTAGKTLYITSAWITVCCQGSAGRAIAASISADDGVALRRIVGTVSACVAASTGSLISGSWNGMAYAIPIPVSATKTVTIATAGDTAFLQTGTLQGGFTGYEI